MYLLISGDTTVLVQQEMPNLQFKCEIVALPRGKTRSIFRSNDTVANIQAPVIRLLSPSTAPHNVAVSVTIYGNGYYDAGVTAFLGATQLTITKQTKDFLVVTVPAALIVSAGTVQITVKNSDGISSVNSPFVVT